MNKQTIQKQALKLNIIVEVWLVSLVFILQMQFYNNGFNIENICYLRNVT